MWQLYDQLVTLCGHHHAHQMLARTKHSPLIIQIILSVSFFALKFWENAGSKWRVLAENRGHTLMTQRGGRPETCGQRPTPKRGMWSWGLCSLSECQTTEEHGHAAVSPNSWREVVCLGCNLNLPSSQMQLIQWKEWREGGRDTLSCHRTDLAPTSNLLGV